MIEVQFKLESTAPISFSRMVASKKAKGENDEAFDQRVVLEKLHLTERKTVMIPPMAVKNCITEYAKYLGEKVKGRGAATWAKNFEAGIMVVDGLDLGVQPKDCQIERLPMNPQGMKGGGKRVPRYYPMVPKWAAAGTMYLIDQSLQQQPGKVREYLEQAGLLIGMGRWRPRNGGMYGRFKVASFTIGGKEIKAGEAVQE